MTIFTWFEFEFVSLRFRSRWKDHTVKKKKGEERNSLFVSLHSLLPSLRFSSLPEGSKHAWKWIHVTKSKPILLIHQPVLIQQVHCFLDGFLSLRMQEAK